MKIDDQILLNRLAQCLVDISEGQRWFDGLGENKRRDVLRELNLMIANASPRPGDIPDAIADSGLKSTYTPCVLLRTGEIRTQLAKIVGLPENELVKAFRLLISLLGVCDSRRRREKPVEPKEHWWHRDLNDPTVVAEIRGEFGNDTQGSHAPGLRPRRIK